MLILANGDDPGMSAGTGVPDVTAVYRGQPFVVVPGSSVSSRGEVRTGCGMAEVAS